MLQVRDVADALLKTAQKITDEELKNLQLTRDHIRFISQDLFGAGFATTMETFRWALNLLAAFPDKQNTMQTELDKVLQGRSPGLRDRDQLPYCEAVLLEVLRISSLVPLSLPHSIVQDTVFRGYFIPKGALVLTNLYGHHRNPEIFPDPFRFHPERFLDNYGCLNPDFVWKIMAFR